MIKLRMNWSDRLFASRREKMTNAREKTRMARRLQAQFVTFDGICFHFDSEEEIRQKCFNQTSISKFHLIVGNLFLLSTEIWYEIWNRISNRQKVS